MASAGEGDLAKLTSLRVSKCAGCAVRCGRRVQSCHPRGCSPFLSSSYWRPVSSTLWPEGLKRSPSFPSASPTVYRGEGGPSRQVTCSESQLTHYRAGPEPRSPKLEALGVPSVSAQAPAGSQGLWEQTLPSSPAVPTCIVTISAHSGPDHLLGAVNREPEDVWDTPPTQDTDERRRFLLPPR